MPAALRVLVHPHRTMASAAPSLAAAIITVLVSAAATAALTVADAAVSGLAVNAASLAAGLVLPLLYLGFWAAAAWLIDAGARAMGRDRALRRFLAASALAYPILVTASLVPLLQALLLRAGVTADVVTAVGVLSLAVAAWFLTVTTFAITATYRLPAASALALVLLPIAVLAAAVLLLVLIADILHAAGVL